MYPLKMLAGILRTTARAFVLCALVTGVATAQSSRPWADQSPQAEPRHEPLALIAAIAARARLSPAAEARPAGHNAGMPPETTA